MDVSRVVEKPQFILSEPAREQAKSAEAAITVDTANLIDATLVGFVEGDHGGGGAIGQTDSSLDRVSLELSTKVSCSDSATMLTHKLYLSSREGF
jgi:hypothetical protein